MRLKEVKALKISYGEMYSWKEQCKALVERMWEMIHGKSCCFETDAENN